MGPRLHGVLQLIVIAYFILAETERSRAGIITLVLKVEDLRSREV